MRNDSWKMWKYLRTYTSVLYLGTSIWFLIQFVEMNMLKPSYQWLVIWGVVLVGAVLCYMLHAAERKAAKTIGNCVAILLSICLAVGAFGLDTMNSLIQGATEHTVQHKDISLIVLKDSELKEVKDIQESDFIGIQNVIYQNSATKMLEELQQELGFSNKTETFANMNEMVSGLYEKKVPIIVLDEAYRNVLEMEWESFSEDTRILYSIEYSEEQVNFAKKIEVSEDKFAVLISGIDTYGEIKSVSRTDVNILAIVNPEKAKVLLVSIPRDYYVPIYSGTQGIAGAEGSMDKLTHSGLFGPECTVRTLENVFDIPINYYVRVNFTSVIDVIDAVGGITIQSDYEFGDFVVGDNECDGEKALKFVRDRYSFKDGDRQRGKNQMKVIEAVIRKLSNPSLQYDYVKLFEAVKDCVEMNFTDEEVKELIQIQVNDKPAWTVESISVNGTDAHDYSYFYGTELYVMYPIQSSIDEAKSKIAEYLE